MTLAAGLGTRLRPYSLLRPKPLFPVLGTPILCHILDQLRHAGAGPIIVNTHHLQDQIVTALQDEADVVLQREEEILGTGGGLRLASSRFGSEPVLVVNGDIYHTIDLRWVYKQHCAADSIATLVLHDCPRFNNVIVADDGRVLGFGDACHSTAGPEKKLAFTGIHVINPDLLSVIPPDAAYNIIDCYREWIRKGAKIRGLVVENHFWTDIGTPADYLALHANLLLRKTLVDPVLSLDRERPFFTGEDVLIGKDVCLSDWVAIGSGARIGDNASLTRVVVWDGAHVPAGADLYDTIVAR